MIDFLILVFNLGEIISKIAYDINIVYEETTIGGLIKILKSLRLFRFLYLTQVLNPLNDLIYAFFLSFRKVGYYLCIIIIYTITVCCVGVEIFANTVRI